MNLNYIYKDSFLFGFKEAHKGAISEANIKSAFRSTGLVPFDPTKLLNHLSLDPRTPPSLPSSPERMWASKTPRNMKELELQITLVKEKIRVLQNSSPTPINDALAKIVNHPAQIATASHKATEEVRVR
jgi:hypothetical protein